MYCQQSTFNKTSPEYLLLTDQCSVTTPLVNTSTTSHPPIYAHHQPVRRVFIIFNIWRPTSCWPHNAPTGCNLIFGVYLSVAMLITPCWGTALLCSGIKQVKLWRQIADISHSTVSTRQPIHNFMFSDAKATRETAKYKLKPQFLVFCRKSNSKDSIVHLSLFIKSIINQAFFKCYKSSFSQAFFFCNF